MELAALVLDISTRSASCGSAISFRANKSGVSCALFIPFHRPDVLIFRLV
jgi:hypothetical protein